MKYLYVKFIDTHTPYLLLMHENIGVQAPARVVKIPLTEEQVRMLEPQCVGELGGKKCYEMVEVICIQEEPEAVMKESPQGGEG